MPEEGGRRDSLGIERGYPAEARGVAGGITLSVIAQRVNPGWGVLMGVVGG